MDLLGGYRHSTVSDCIMNHQPHDTRRRVLAAWSCLFLVIKSYGIMQQPLWWNDPKWLGTCPALDVDINTLWLNHPCWPLYSSNWWKFNISDRSLQWSAVLGYWAVRWSCLHVVSKSRWRDLLKLDGYIAGPEIDKSVQRFLYDSNDLLKMVANWIFVNQKSYSIWVKSSVPWRPVLL